MVFLNFSHCDGCAEESHCGLICISLGTNEVRQLSHVYCTYWTLLGSEVSVKVSDLLFLLVDCSVLIWPSALYTVDPRAWEKALERTWYIHIKKTESSIRSKVKIMSSADKRSRINLKLLWTEEDTQKRENLRGTIKKLIN